jgi:hypothetical protein
MDIGAGRVGAVSNGSRAVQSSPVAKKKTSSAAFVPNELGRCPLAVPVLPCGFSLPSLPSLKCSVCGGTTRVVAKGLEGAWARHRVELYTPRSPMARRTVRWQSEGTEGRYSTLAGARAIRRGVIRIGDSKIEYHKRLAVSGGVRRFCGHGGIGFTRAVRVWRAQATGVRGRVSGLALTASRGGKGNLPSRVACPCSLSNFCLGENRGTGQAGGRR